MTTVNYSRLIGRTMHIPSDQVGAAIELLDQGNTMPFVARYRKEATGGLDEEQLRQIESEIGRLRRLEERRAAILASLTEQDQLTKELESRIHSAESLTILEDYYRPYKPKRRTRASIAIEKGLQPLAELILSQERSGRSPMKIAQSFVSTDVPSPTEALAGARDIVAERISDHSGVRGLTREKALKWAVLQSAKAPTAADERSIFSLYYEFSLPVDRLKPHQVLALNRGETEKVLRIRIDVSERDWLLAVRTAFRPDRRSSLAGELQLAIEDAAKRLLLPAVERDVRRELTETAEAHAISVFARNLRALLSQPPLTGHVVLAIDPAYRTGCKVAVVDDTGKALHTTTIYPHPPQGRWDEALGSLRTLAERYRISLVAIGNGTASRETEKLVAQLAGQIDGLQYLMVNEAGASVYSASPLARRELPELDVSLRGAVSIGRRAQDPLAELVKIDPRSIGVGLYQHDVDQKALESTLSAVVESVVNQVGVDVNTASPALLTYVSGIGPKLAESIVQFRDQEGPFATRKRYLDVPGLGPKAFEQSAGFLRINGGGNPLDASAIHPESYTAATAILKRARVDFESSPEQRRLALQSLPPVKDLAPVIGTGVLTLEDILQQLAQPGRDPRTDLPPPILRSDVLSMNDLAVGMQLMGTVRNVVDFGAFVDIGVKQDGLLHRSQIPGGKALEVGDILTVRILKVDNERGRISLGYES